MASVNGDLTGFTVTPEERKTLKVMIVVRDIKDIIG
jgi:hypothetical protein